MANSKWTIDRFLPAYLEAAEKGMTREEFAESIGLKAETVYQRVYNLRRSRKDIPLLRAAGKIPMLEQADKIMEAYRSKRQATAPMPANEPATVPVHEEDSSEEVADIADILGLN